MDVVWRNDLETWLPPFVSALAHKTGGRMCPSHVSGLIGAGDRKSVQPSQRAAGRRLHLRPHTWAGFVYVALAAPPFGS